MMWNKWQKVTNYERYYFLKSILYETLPDGINILHSKTSEKALNTSAGRTLISVSQIFLLYVSPDFVWQITAVAKIE